MKGLSGILIVIACLSLILSVISRVTMRLLPIAPGGIDAESLLLFANTCFLVAITLELAKKK